MSVTNCSKSWIPRNLLTNVPSGLEKASDGHSELSRFNDGLGKAHEWPAI